MQSDNCGLTMYMYHMYTCIHRRKQTVYSTCVSIYKYAHCRIITALAVALAEEQGRLTFQLLNEYSLLNLQIVLKRSLRRKLVYFQPSRSRPPRLLRYHYCFAGL